MAKRLSGSSARGALRKMKPEDIKSRQWSEAEVEAVRKASDAQSAGRDLPKAEYEDIHDSQRSSWRAWSASGT